MPTAFLIAISSPMAARPTMANHALCNTRSEWYTWCVAWAGSSSIYDELGPDQWPYGLENLDNRLTVSRSSDLRSPRPNCSPRLSNTAPLTITAPLRRSRITHAAPIDSGLKHISMQRTPAQQYSMSPTYPSPGRLLIFSCQRIYVYTGWSITAMCRRRGECERTNPKDMAAVHDGQCKRCLQRLKSEVAHTSFPYPYFYMHKVSTGYQ